MRVRQRCGTAQYKYLTSDNARDVCSMTSALVERIGIRYGYVSSRVFVADQIVSPVDLVTWAEASTKSGMGIVDTSVDDSDLDPLAQYT